MAQKLRKHGKNWKKTSVGCDIDFTILLSMLKVKVCFVVCDNGFSQIFYNCSNVEEIFSWHNIASSLSQNMQQKF